MTRRSSYSTLILQGGVGAKYFQLVHFPKLCTDILEVQSSGSIHSIFVFYFIISFTFPLIDCYKGKLLQGIFICFFGIFNYVYFHHIFYLVNCRNIQLKKASNWQFRIARVAISEQAHSTFWLCGTFFTFTIIQVVWGPQLPRVNYNWNFYQNSVLTTLRLPNELSICVPLTSFPPGRMSPPTLEATSFEQQFQSRSQM